MWALHQAKARLSELIERAKAEGPQTIARHGVEQAVVLSMEEYRQLRDARPDFKAFLLGGPKWDDFEIERDRTPMREIDFDE